MMRGAEAPVTDMVVEMHSRLKHQGPVCFRPVQVWWQRNIAATDVQLAATHDMCSACNELQQQY
jgi:hypothetical protein